MRYLKSDVTGEEKLSVEITHYDTTLVKETYRDKKFEEERDLETIKRYIDTAIK